MAYGVSNGHVIDEDRHVPTARWPRKVKLVTSIRLLPNISKTDGDAV